MKEIIKSLSIVVVTGVLLVGFFFWGVHTERNKPLYPTGEVSFCDLTEADRFKVCPALRDRDVLTTGGEVVAYLCRSSHISGYIETKNLSPQSKRIVESDFKVMREVKGLTIQKLCNTEYGTVYKVEE